MNRAMNLHQAFWKTPMPSCPTYVVRSRLATAGCVLDSALVCSLSEHLLLADVLLNVA